MSIDAVGSFLSIWSLLQTLGSSSSPSQSAQQSPASDESAFSDRFDTTRPPKADERSSVSGRSHGSLGDDIIALLMSLQETSSADASSASNSDSSASSEVSLLDLLFGAIDGDCNASISKSELTSFADSLGSADSRAAPPPPGDRVAGDLVAQIDADGNGALSQSELQTFAQSNGGTGSQADAIFSALDSESDDALTSSEIAAGMRRFEAMQASMIRQAMSSTLSINT